MFSLRLSLFSLFIVTVASIYFIFSTYAEDERKDEIYNIYEEQVSITNNYNLILSTLSNDEIIINKDIKNILKSNFKNVENYLIKKKYINKNFDSIYTTAELSYSKVVNINYKLKDDYKKHFDILCKISKNNQNFHVTCNKEEYTVSYKTDILM